MLSFAWYLLFVLLPLPWLITRFASARPGPAGAALRLPAVGLLERPAGDGGGRARHAGWLAWLVWVLLVTAAARPQWLGEPEGLIVSGRDLMLAIDLSGSMEARDFQTDDGWVDRLTGVRKVAGDFIDRRTGDRLGLILFGSEAYVQAPLTFDRPTLQTLLDEAFIGLAGRRTAIGDAIALAVRTLADSPAESGDRVLVLFTDGVSNTGELEPLQATALAERQGLRIHTIGFGTDGDAVGARSGGTDLDEAVLGEIAGRTGGRYFRARDAAELEAIYAELDRLEPVPDEHEGYRPVRELYPWPLALAGVAGLALLLPGGGWRRPVPTARPGRGTAVGRPSAGGGAVDAGY